MTDRELAHAAADLFSIRHRIPFAGRQSPEDQNRQAPAVELVCLDFNRDVRLVVEHTLLESVPGQLTHAHAVETLLGPLEPALDGALPQPGRYRLDVYPAETLGLKSKGEEIRSWVAAWVKQTAPTLEVGHQTTAPRHFREVTVPDTRLGLRLARWPGTASQFRIVFNMPKDFERLRRVAFTTALDRKCPKLAAEKSLHRQAASLLLLEIRDIGLGDPFAVMDLVREEVPHRTNHQPDHIYVLDTAGGGQPVVWVAKEGAFYWPEQQGSGPYDLPLRR